MHRRKHQQLLGRWLNFTKPENAEQTEDLMRSSSSLLGAPDPASLMPLARAISSSGSSTGVVSVGSRRRLRNTLPSRDGASSFDGSCADDDSTEGDAWEHPLKSTMSVKSTESSVGKEQCKQQQSPLRVFSKSPRKGKGKDSHTTSSLKQRSPDVPSLQEHVLPTVSHDTLHEARKPSAAECSHHKSSREDSWSAALSSGLKTGHSNVGHAQATFNSTDTDLPVASLPLMIQKIDLDEAVLRDDASTGSLSHRDRDLRNRKDPSRNTTSRAHPDDLHMSFAVHDLIVQDDDDGPDIEVYSKKEQAERRGKFSHHQSFESSGGGILEFAILQSEMHPEAPKTTHEVESRTSNEMNVNANDFHSDGLVRCRSTTLPLPQVLAFQSTDGLPTQFINDTSGVAPFGATARPSDPGQIKTRPSSLAGQDQLAWDTDRRGCTVGTHDWGRYNSESNAGCEDLDADLSDSLGERDASSVLFPAKLSAIAVNRVFHASSASLNFDELYQDECYSGRQHHSLSTFPSPRTKLNVFIGGDGRGEPVLSSIDQRRAQEAAAAAEQQMIQLAVERSLRQSVDHYDSSLDSNKQSSRASVSVSTVYVPDMTATQRLQPHDHSFSSHASYSSQRRGVIGPEDISTSEDQEREMIELALELSLQDSKASQASISSRSESVSTAHTDTDYPYLDTGSSHSKNSKFSHRQQPRPQQVQHRASDVDSTSVQAARGKQPVNGSRFSHENSLLFELDDYDDDDNDEALLTPARVKATHDLRQSWIGPCPPPPPPPPESQIARFTTEALPASPSQRISQTQSPHDHSAFHHTSTFDGRPRPMYEWERKLVNSELTRNSYLVASHGDEDEEDHDVIGGGVDWHASPSSFCGEVQDAHFHSQSQAYSPENRHKPTSFTTPQHSPDGWSRRSGPSQSKGSGQSKGLEDLRSIENQLEAEEFWVRQPSPQGRRAPKVETEAERMQRVEREMMELAMNRSIRES